MIQIREGVFETNSSSTHSICMCLKSEFEAWKNGDYIYNSWHEKLFDAKELREYINGNEWLEHLREKANNLSDRELIEFVVEEEGGEWQSYEDWCNSSLEGYHDEFTTPSGETVVAFGEFGFDG